MLLFASLRDRAGGRKFIDLELSAGATVLALKDQASRQIPALKVAMPTILVAVDHEFAGEDTVVPPGAEIAMFPPVSGG